jgi:outer membrane receptor protein involved in Fe transport
MMGAASSVFAQQEAPASAEPTAATEAAPAAEAVEPASTAATAEAAPAASDDKNSVRLEAVQVTGSRVVVPGATSSSPIVTIRAEEFVLQQNNEVEQVLRNLPSTLPGDGANTNNGSAGVSTLNLRGLGEQRNLILIDGKRVTPYNVDGLVDLSMIPAQLIERVDLVTGGASAVYGSDAVSGAVNFIIKRNFQGLDVDYNNAITGEGDGDKSSIALTLGANVAEGRGNLVMSVNYGDRDGILLGQRPLGQLGIATASGQGLAAFRAGTGPIPAPAGCEAEGSVAIGGGSGTAIPTRLTIAGSGQPTRQFRNDGTLAAPCSAFNFNPFNYYETPQERYGAAAFGRFEFNEHAEAYSRFLFGNTTVRQQVAPSGIFNNSYFTPLSNPFIGASALQTIIGQAETARAAGRLNAANGTQNWRDRNNNGVVDAPDSLLLTYARRTSELGARSTTFKNDAHQMQFGLRGALIPDWDYDVSYQRGQSNRTEIRAGYTNLVNVGNALDSTDGVTCANGDPTCVPINLFGGFGTITPAMAQYSSATALISSSYVQHITTASVAGLLSDIKHSPFASRPVGLSFGVERRREEGDFIPDECLRVAPTSCQGGAGGFLLPIAGGFGVNEAFTEAIVPLVDGKPFFDALDLELGYRWADYNPTGLNRTWKYGLSWAPTDSTLVRVMRQRAARAPTVGELASPQTTALSNAAFDPCSEGNPAAANPSPELRARCVATGVNPADVGRVQDIIAGQINAFSGTDLDNLPDPEKADTTTVGIVLKPKSIGVIRNPYLSVDYYDIKVNDFIGNFGAQEVLDQCYNGGVSSECDKIVRVNGNLIDDGSGVELFTTNLKYLQAEGVEVIGSFGLNSTDFGMDVGKLRVNAVVNYYLTNESQSSSANEVIDCKGFYGTQCGNPLPTTRFIQRTTWDVANFEFSYLWRYIGSSKVEEAQRAAVFSEFREIKAYNYLDLSVGYNVTKKIKVSALVNNVFEKDPPVVGNEAGSTATNSGNTFPAVYDTLGRVYSFGLNATF